MSSLNTPIYVALGLLVGPSGFTSKNQTYAVLLMRKPFLVLSGLITSEENFNIFISAVFRTIFSHTAHLMVFYICSNLLSQICLTFFPQSQFLMTVDSNYKNATIPYSLFHPSPFCTPFDIKLINLTRFFYTLYTSLKLAFGDIWSTHWGFLQQTMKCVAKVWWITLSSVASKFCRCCI